MSRQPDTNDLRKVLIAHAQQQQTLDYKSLTKLLGITPPNSIHQTTQLLEACQQDDALLHQPQLAAIVISKASDPIPRPGFFQTLKNLGIYSGSEQGAEAQMWHQNELEKVFEFYR
ncbi:hypothetical protein [Reinekea marinisedimentorum]|uniref:Uncharacterized protein n=1 Tax=Reinekea marinisedimentorum TaxID=230495 RepID=A0A4R3IBI7_9GAMM|nr:hypothetical protein [Reinekea marinisedimentorum]TCS42641.1 hypothetical protein BCF53_103309 [Reinekea marinisedimentorum]